MIVDILCLQVHVWEVTLGSFIVLSTCVAYSVCLTLSVSQTVRNNNGRMFVIIYVFLLFDEIGRMRSGKQRSSRKHKRKNAVTIQPPAKKKKQQHPQPQQQQQQQQQQGSPAASYDVPSVKLRIIEEPSPNLSGNDPTCSKWAENNAKGMRNVRKAKHLSDNGSLAVSQQRGESNEINELNLKLSELRGTLLTDKENMNGVAVNIQEDQSGEGVSPSYRNSDVNGQNSVWANRSGGAKRRKSGNVKRFKQDADPRGTKDGRDAMDRLAGGNGVVVEHRVQNFEQVGTCYGSMNVVDTSKSMYAITKIVKPIEYSVSTLDEMQDILVTFLVLRFVQLSLFYLSVFIYCITSARLISMVFYTFHSICMMIAIIWN